MLEKPIPEQDEVPDVFELVRRVNEPFQKREARSAVPIKTKLKTLEEKFAEHLGESDPCGLSPDTDESSLVEPEPAPIKNDLPYMWPKAMERFAKLAQARDEFGANKYGTRLQPFNGRNPTTDALQELLDAFVYFEQMIFEAKYKQPVIDAAIDLVKTLRESVKHPKFLKLVEVVDALSSVSGKVDKV